VLEEAAFTLAILAVALSVAAVVLARKRRPDPTAEARRQLQTLVEEETTVSADELKARLARLRADSLSTLAEDERRIADERRQELAERERAAGVELAEALAATQRRVDERLRGWRDDLDRTQQALETELRRLEQRQKQLIAEAEARIEAEASELVATSDEQRASVLRLREELERAAQQAVAEALEELEAHTSERRRVIEEIAERLRRREQALTEQVDRAETEAVRRIEASFADIERRQLEQLQRAIAREAERHADAAGVQFDASMKSAREEAAGRLARELDRAVETFVRQADAVFAERLAQTGDAGQQRLEQRQRQAQAAFERQREELVASFQERVSAADADLRRMLGAFAAEAEAERSAISDRLADLHRRVDEASSLRRA
jgi:localization factor PodJL